MVPIKAHVTLTAQELPLNCRWNFPGTTRERKRISRFVPDVRPTQCRGMLSEFLTGFRDNRPQENLRGTPEFRSYERII